jgi:hypothetical protein
VGAANGRNPLPIILPCHRVIGSNGALTGFGGGLETKAALLRLEQRQAPVRLKAGQTFPERGSTPGDPGAVSWAGHSHRLIMHG